MTQYSSLLYALLERKAWVTYLLVIATGLTILDLYITFVGLQKGLIEGNPVMHYVLANLGIVDFLFIDVVLSASLLGFLVWGSMEKLEGKWRYLPLGVYCVGRGIFVVNNILLFIT